MYGLTDQPSGHDLVQQVLDKLDFDEEFVIENDEVHQKNLTVIADEIIEAEDIHSANKVVLQRQFFEAIVRAAYIKYQNNVDLPTLADKLDYLFK